MSFFGDGLSLGHFGQQIPESCVSAPKWCINKELQALQTQTEKLHSADQAAIVWEGAAVRLISTKGALRLPTTYDNHPNQTQPNPIPSIPSTYSCEDDLFIEDLI